MKFAVRYYTKTGNTKKLAAAIADALGFSDAAHLSRCFYRETGCHAGEMRRRR